MAIYACSDIHGQYGLYKKMLEEINFSSNDTMYILGDIVDRGPKSIEIFRDVMKRDNVICILGNHELMMYSHLRREYPSGEYWTMTNNGGLITRKRFKSLSKKEQNDILDYIKDMYLQVETEVNGMTYLLSHSSFLNEKGTTKWYGQDAHRVFDAVWDAPWRFMEYRPLYDYKEDERMHVIGHVPVQRIRDIEWPGEKKPEMPAAYVDKENNLINIDLGCARMNVNDGYGGKALCCMNLGAFASGKDAFTYVTGGE